MQTVVEEFEYKDELTNFLYNKMFGRFLLKAFLARPWFNKMIGVYYKSRLSQKDIAPFVAKYGIRLKKHSIQDFKTFNEFFTRSSEEEPPLTQQNELVSPACGKLSCYKITDDLRLRIKQSNYSLDEIVGSKTIARRYKGGTCLVYRMSVTDNHRYNFIDNGTTVLKKFIPGMLHTVRPISEEYNVFARNARVVNVMDTENFGRVTQIEIGALLVGKMHNHDLKAFSKNEEKGYFEFGGSTIIVLLQDPVAIDEDIVQMNEQGIETKVCAGEKIGMLLPQKISK